MVLHQIHVLLISRLLSNAFRMVQQYLHNCLVSRTIYLNPYVLLDPTQYYTDLLSRLLTVRDYRQFLVCGCMQADAKLYEISLQTSQIFEQGVTLEDRPFRHIVVEEGSQIVLSSLNHIIYTIKWIIFIIRMVKFFMPGSKAQKPPKKPTDYKIIVYQEMLGVMKSKHLKYISRIVKSLKQNKQMGQYEKNHKQTLLQGYKSIKKNEMKLLTLYILIKYLNIANLSSIQQFTKSMLPSSQSIISTIQESKVYHNFIAQVSKSHLFQSILEKTAGFCDNISKKKHITKERSKERKLRKKSQKQRKQQYPIYQLQQQALNDGQENGKEQIKRQYEEHNEFDQQVQPKKREYKRDNKNMFEREEPKRQRSQFIKKGRNKALQKKKQKKNRYKERQNVEVHQQKQQKPKRQKPQNLHPSWSAKIEEKMFIQPFQGQKKAL